MFDASKAATLLSNAENGLKEIMLAEKAVVYIVDVDGKSFYKYNAEGEKVFYPIDTGIVGLVAKGAEAINVPDPYNHPFFNPEVDLKTDLPLICLPVMSTKEENRVLAVMQVLDLKLMGKGRRDLIESETIRLFQIQVAVCLERFNKIKTLRLGESEASYSFGVAWEREEREGSEEER